jgi:Major Facilitator Superfamily
MRPWQHYFSPPPGAVQGSILILLPFALAHFISYLFRSANAVIYPDLVRDLGLSANTLGLLTSTYFIAFAAAQLPVGMALDRFGPRKVQVPMLMVAMLGGILFAKAESLETLALARGLIGFGVAASLMSAIKASTLWLPSERWPMVTAILLSFGGMGGMAATAPLQFALDQVGWRTAFLGLAGCTAFVAVLIFTTVPEHPHKQDISVKDMLTSIGKLYQDGPFWRIVLCTLFTNGAYMAIQGLWLGPWLSDVAKLPRPEVAQVLFWGHRCHGGGLAVFWLDHHPLARLPHSPHHRVQRGLGGRVGHSSFDVVRDDRQPLGVGLGVQLFWHVGRDELRDLDAARPQAPDWPCQHLLQLADFLGRVCHAVGPGGHHQPVGSRGRGLP